LFIPTLTFIDLRDQMLVSVYVLGSSLSVHTKSEKLRQSRDYWHLNPPPKG